MSTTYRRNHRMLAKRLACVYIAQMYFNHWYAQRGNGVTQGKRIMRQCPCIDDDTIRRAGLLNSVNQHPLMVRLKTAYRAMHFFAPLAQSLVYVRQGHCPIDRWLTSSQRIEIWPIENHDVQ